MSDDGLTWVDISAERPNSVCRECAARALHHESGVTFRYCAHRLSGAYRIAGGEWRHLRHIAAGNFRQAVACRIALVQMELAREADGAKKH